MLDLVIKVIIIVMITIMIKWQSHVGAIRPLPLLKTRFRGACPLTSGFCSVGSAERTRVGWTIGGGAEFALASQWTAKMEYLYFDLGSVSYPVISTANFGPFAAGNYANLIADTKFTGQIVRIGLNYRF